MSFRVRGCPFRGQYGRAENPRVGGGRLRLGCAEPRLLRNNSVPGRPITRPLAPSPVVTYANRAATRWRFLRLSSGGARAAGRRLAELPELSTKQVRHGEESRHERQRGPESRASGGRRGRGAPGGEGDAVKGSNVTQNSVRYCFTTTYRVQRPIYIGRLQTYITPLQIYMGPMSVHIGLLQIDMWPTSIHTARL